MCTLKRTRFSGCVQQLLPQLFLRSETLRRGSPIVQSAVPTGGRSSAGYLFTLCFNLFFTRRIHATARLRRYQQEKCWKNFEIVSHSADTNAVRTALLTSGSSSPGASSSPLGDLGQLSLSCQMKLGPANHRTLEDEGGFLSDLSRHRLLGSVQTRHTSIAPDRMRLGSQQSCWPRMYGNVNVRSEHIE